MVLPYKDTMSEELAVFNEQTAEGFMGIRTIQADHRPVVFIIIVDQVPAGAPVTLRKAGETIAETVTKMDNSLGIPIAKIKVWVALSDSGKIFTATGEAIHPETGKVIQMTTDKQPITVYQDNELVLQTETSFLDNLLISLRLKEAPQAITRAEVFAFPYRWVFIGSLVILIGVSGYYIWRGRK
jgi:hypothetical protein